ncbi:ion transporter [Streptomyces sp. P38-E01]|uniref:Ion transporter n=1 Tax=Streptomyces tardus TaxID=2780544 RepID=A0A949JG85_9ACTN|nr:ion transporter [Streptomyces tardus]MBU7597959.1 ion transporter [Streptomyces tardus]
MTDEVTAAPPSARSAVAQRCRRITDTNWFGTTAFVLILGNAAVLGVETYDGVVERWHGQLQLVEHGFLTAFTVEVVLRAAAHADRPRDFLRDPWNVFDLSVVLFALLPIAQDNATALRLLRLARVLRAVRFLPQLRIVVTAIGKSLPGTASFVLVGTLLLYVYAMIGWVFFADEDPERFGSLGRAALSLLLLMALDGLGDAVRTGLEITRWSILYYTSYVLLSSFVLVNLLIGVVINSLEEAREAERQQRPDLGPDSAPTSAPAPFSSDDSERLQSKIITARLALDDLQNALDRQAAPERYTLPGAEHPAPEHRPRADASRRGAPPMPHADSTAER